MPDTHHSPSLPTPSDLRGVQATNAIRRMLLKALTLFNTNSFVEAKAAVVESVAGQAQAASELRTALTVLYHIAGAGPRENPLAMITSEDEPMQTYKIGVLAGQYEIAEYARSAIRGMKHDLPATLPANLRSEVLNYTFISSDHGVPVDPEADLGFEDMPLDRQFALAQS